MLMISPQGVIITVGRNSIHRQNSRLLFLHSAETGLSLTKLSGLNDISVLIIKEYHVFVVNIRLDMEP